MAVFTLGLAAWYLELPKREVAFGTFILGCAYPVMSIVELSIGIEFPGVFISLAILTILFTASLAMISDRYLLDRFRGSSINTLIVTFALALILQSIVHIFYFPQGGNQLATFGAEERVLSTIVPKETVKIFGASIRNIRIIAFVLAILAGVFLYIFIWFSKMGMALRAVSQDEEAAALAGIDIRKTTAVVSGIGMGLVAFAAVFTSPFAATPYWSPTMGWWVLIMAIAVVTLGGEGSLPGSVIGAFIIGYTEILIASAPGTTVLLGATVYYQSLSVAVPLIVVLLVMIFKPEGLLGEKKELEG
ncbi:MAG: branched-chain amino acid ABC transporter permease [Candidatus Hodarchaeota archaeon]